MNSLLLIGTFLSGIAVLVDIIGTAIPYWWVASFEWYSIEVRTNVGLFRSCVVMKNFAPYECSARDPKYSTNWWKATQATVILSILTMTAGVGLTIRFVMKDKQTIPLSAPFMTFTGAVLAIIGVIIFGVNTNEFMVKLFLTDGELRFHAGFGLVITSAILAVLASVIIFLSRKSNVQHYKQFLWDDVKK